MQLAQQLREANKKGVEIFVGKKKCCQQPQTFQLCPLGLQFYSPKKLEDLTLLEFNLAIPAEGRKKKESVTCTGAVVRCQHEKAADRYRVWIKFLDLPENARESIRCVSRDGKHLCCFCENF
jgi:hypothetical protein